MTVIPENSETTIRMGTTKLFKEYSDSYKDPLRT